MSIETGPGLGLATAEGFAQPGYRGEARRGEASRVERENPL